MGTSFHYETTYLRCFKSEAFISLKLNFGQQNKNRKVTKGSKF